MFFTSHLTIPMFRLKAASFEGSHVVEDTIFVRDPRNQHSNIKQYTTYKVTQILIGLLHVDYNPFDSTVGISSLSAGSFQGCRSCQALLWLPLALSDPGARVSSLTVKNIVHFLRFFCNNYFFFRFAGAIIPPLPEKQISGRFEAEFIERRRR